MNDAIAMSIPKQLVLQSMRQKPTMNADSTTSAYVLYHALKSVALHKIINKPYIVKSRDLSLKKFLGVTKIWPTRNQSMRKNRENPKIVDIRVLLSLQLLSASLYTYSSHLNSYLKVFGFQKSKSF